MAINTRWDMCHAAGQSEDHDSSVKPPSEWLSYARWWGTRGCRRCRWSWREQQVPSARDKGLIWPPCKELTTSQKWESHSQIPILPGSDKAIEWDAELSDEEGFVVDAASNDVAPTSGTAG